MKNFFDLDAPRRAGRSVLPVALALARRAALCIAALGAACATSKVASLDAAPAVALPDRYYPQGLTATADATLFTGSLTEGDIRIVRAGSRTAEVFVAGGAHGLASVLGLLADERNDTLWACSNSWFGFNKHNAGSPATLFGFDLRTGALKRRYPLPVPTTGAALCNDIAVDARGRVFVTDSLQPRVLRLDTTTGTFDEWMRDASGAIVGGRPNYNGIAFAPDGSMVVGNIAAGRLYRVGVDKQGRATTVQEIALQRPLLQPDGVRSVGDDRVLVAEQAQTLGDGRQGKLLMVTPSSGRIVEVATGLISPAATVVVGRRVHFIEGQYAALFGSLPGATPGAFAIRSVALPAE